MRIQWLKWSGTTKDARGNTVPAFDQPVTIECVVAPRDSSEDSKPGFENRTVTDFTLFEVTEPVTAKDRFMIEGQLFQVEGKPFDWAKFDPYTPFTTGTQVALRAVTG